jgi:Ohr subfamily peroxiredoxin
MRVLYETSATATGGREGKASTKDGTFSVSLSTPKELGGAGGTGNNPEQLFASGYSACFLGALKFAASKDRIKIPADATVTADVGIGARDDGQGFGLEVALVIKVPGIDRAVVEDLVQKAHVICPYSHATKGNIPVTLTVA